MRTGSHFALVTSLYMVGIILLAFDPDIARKLGQDIINLFFFGGMFAIGGMLLLSMKAETDWNALQKSQYGYVKEPYGTSEVNPTSRRFAPILLAAGEFVGWLGIAFVPGLKPDAISQIGLANALVWQSLASTFVVWLMATGKLGTGRLAVVAGLTIDIIVGIISLVISGWIPPNEALAVLLRIMMFLSQAAGKVMQLL